jgi:hypothetical protein
VRIGRTKDVRRFCVVDGWRRKADAPGRRVAKHEVWEKTLASGVTLRTLISKSRETYAKGVFAAILKHQLQVTEQEFWTAVDKRRAPARPQTASARPAGEALPLELVRELLAAGHTLADLRGLSAEQAAELLTGAAG